MRVVKIILLILLIILIAIQFIRPELNKTDEPSADAINTGGNVPQEVMSILERSCYDCHSNNSVYPWYFKIQPVAWYLAHHIEEGKDELNFDAFGSYTAKRKAKKFDEIAEVIEEEEMPLTSYTFIHNDAKLTEAERKMLISWAIQSKDSITANAATDSTGAIKP